MLGMKPPSSTGLTRLWRGIEGGFLAPHHKWGAFLVYRRRLACRNFLVGAGRPLLFALGAPEAEDALPPHLYPACPACGHGTGLFSRERVVRPYPELNLKADRQTRQAVSSVRSFIELTSGQEPFKVRPLK
jgi:hypothetical protein